MLRTMPRASTGKGYAHYPVRMTGFKGAAIDGSEDRMALVAFAYVSGACSSAFYEKAGTGTWTSNPVNFVPAYIG